MRKPLGKSASGTYREHMKHVTFGDKSLLIGDQATDLLLEYASLLATESKADTVTLRAISPDGNETEATFLLDSGVALIAETTISSLPDLDNADAVAYMQERIMLLSSPPPVRPHDETMPENYEDLNL
ncbi:hypothetical protein GCM10011313_15870 [Mycetocola zhadangensis]|nr:hypothetical protein GCM10011313_15870 [Mycetocola zhadangensis]